MGPAVPFVCFRRVFTGALFPLDILSGPLYLIAKSLRFSISSFSAQSISWAINANRNTAGFSIGFVWTAGLWWLAVIVWYRGLRAYTAEGNNDETHKSLHQDLVKLTVSSFMISLTSRFNAGVFLWEIFTVPIFLLFLMTIFTRLNARRVLISSNDFFIIVSLVDTIAQLFFREVYRFRPLIVSGILICPRQTHEPASPVLLVG